MSQNAIIKSGTAIDYGFIKLHPDLEGLIWIGDGKYKNYSPDKNLENTFELNGFVFSLEFSNMEEPSLIYTKLPIKAPETPVERPPYWPRYSDISPEQRFMYLQLLTNPYNTKTDIGYVFILYYGLERHLLQGNFERAYRLILKLRDVHKNKSFQYYTANALILTAKLHKREDMLLEFLGSLNKEYELQFSENLLLLLCYEFNISISPKIIIRLAKIFEFTNTNYIKKYPEIFEKNLKETLIEKYGNENFSLNNVFNKAELKKLKLSDVNIFANISILNKTFQVPLMRENFRLKNELYAALKLAHEKTKSMVAKNRKSGNPLAPVAPKKRSPKKKEAPELLERARIQAARSAGERQKNIVKSSSVYTGKLTWVRDKSCNDNCKYYNYCDKSYDVNDSELENWPPLACCGRLRPELKSDAEIWELTRQGSVSPTKEQDKTQQKTDTEYKPNFIFVLIIILGFILLVFTKVLEVL
ncbi:hypothetical protein NO2_0412 [Candidatus Termititenax persephonae]|uniref:TerB N-terminal domain-containing protein n=1 Tax=Candidatus Termititenax persephonae TaxID=2218525 RepID=A0A388TGI8_9BACT|nr:hypothetical protein NO2_0412 [Candidatus Termititenax persephonae]